MHKTWIDSKLGNIADVLGDFFHTSEFSKNKKLWAEKISTVLTRETYNANKELIISYRDKLAATPEGQEDHKWGLVIENFSGKAVLTPLSMRFGNIPEWHFE